MNDIFNARVDAFRRVMSGSGATTPHDALPSALAQDESQAECPSCSSDAVSGRCDECSGICRECGGAFDEQSAVQQALSWAVMTSRAVQDPLWRLAQINQIMSDAPANDGGPAWESVARTIQDLQAVITFGAQGKNATLAIGDALRREKAAASRGDALWGALDPDGGPNPVKGASVGDPPPQPAPKANDPAPGDGKGDTPSPASDPTPQPAGGDQCCCKAADIFVDGKTVASGSSYSSKVVVTLDVNQGKGPPKGCSLEWEELPSHTYGPRIGGKDVGPPVPGGVYSNLTSHPVFRALAKKALADLTATCPVSITPFTDTPRMGITGRLVIRITLKSGCDDTSVTVYVVLTAPTYEDSGAVTDPVVVKSEDPDFKKLEAEYKKTPKPTLK